MTEPAAGLSWRSQCVGAVVGEGDGQDYWEVDGGQERQSAIVSGVGGPVPRYPWTGRRLSPHQAWTQSLRRSDSRDWVI
jgi:hypothetical protein